MSILLDLLIGLLLFAYMALLFIPL